MKVIKETEVRGKRRITVELDKGEELTALRGEGHYRLGYPHDEVIAAHVITDAVPVVWCSFEQKWID